MGKSVRRSGSHSVRNRSSYTQSGSPVWSADHRARDAQGRRKRPGKSLGGSPGTDAAASTYMRELIVFIKKNADLLIQLAEAAIEQLTRCHRRR